MKYVRVLSFTIMAVCFALPLEAATATWDRNPESDVTGYRLSYGTQSGIHDVSVDVGNVISVPFSPPPGRRYYIVVQAYNSAGGLSPKSAEIIYDAPATQNQPPVLTQPANQSSNQNTAQSLALVATDPEGTALIFGASGLPPGLAVNAATGVIAGTVTTAGTYTVTATASDGSLTATRSFTWTVTAATGVYHDRGALANGYDDRRSTPRTQSSVQPAAHLYVSGKSARSPTPILMKFDLSQIASQRRRFKAASLQLSLMNAVDTFTLQISNL